ncbi:DUF2304 domain-containing protein [Patescibacteria group bacterium]|nr:DUF2304 domain-containing protein [Patescibacteria group bacterium]
MVIQYIATIIIALIILQLLSNLKKDKVTWSKTLIWIIFWGAGMFIVWFPKIIADIAQVSGVGRGVDVIIYVSIIFLFYLLSNQNSKIDELNKQITKLTREIAKNNAKTK